MVMIFEDIAKNSIISRKGFVNNLSSSNYRLQKSFDPKFYSDIKKKRRLTYFLVENWKKEGTCLSLRHRTNQESHLIGLL